MNRVIALAFTVALAVAVVTAGSIRAAGPEKDKPADEATALAVKLTEQGATTFDTFNAKAMADYYLEDAEIAMVSKEEGRLKVQTHTGRAEIEKFYADIFKKPETIKSRNTVEYAKLIAPDVLVIAGTFDTNTLKPDSPRVPFYQVRVKKGDQWLMSSVRIFVLPRK
ncbi:MAG: hypothetical protein ACLQU5_23940 [Isosphaeraceae bacterium]